MVTLCLLLLDDHNKFASAAMSTKVMAPPYPLPVGRRSITYTLLTLQSLFIDCLVGSQMKAKVAPEQICPLSCIIILMPTTSR